MNIMEDMETVKTVLTEMLETAGENGVTEEEAVREVVKHGLDFRAATDSLRSSYKEAGAERHIGAVIYYRKAKPKSEKKEDSTAVKLAKKLGQRNIGEKHYNEVINYYRK